MKTYKVGVIRVLTTEDETVLNRHGKLLERYYPMFQVTSRCIPEQFEGVHDEETERQWKNGNLVRVYADIQGERLTFERSAQ